VNLTPEECPEDIYQTVADLARELIEADNYEEDADYKKMWLAYDREHGITRSTVKHNVMTYGYSGTKFGMAKDQLNDLIMPMDREALLSGTHRPFGARWEQRNAASRYLAKKVYQAIEQIVAGPAEAKAFLRGLADAASDAGSVVRWTTPVGIPWINRYYQPKFKQIKLWLHDRPVPYATKRIVGEQRKINKEKAANSVAPNFVHALDAAHLMRTVNAAVSDGITSIATVHDSFGFTVPSRPLPQDHSRGVLAYVRGARRLAQSV
jgi:DNA-directed RNA polymerase, mitochondrial